MDLYETPLPIREDLQAAHRSVVDRWADAGTWWTAAERVAIVEEVRRARDADSPPPPWVAASSVKGLVGEGQVLTSEAVDAIWRLTNHHGISPLRYTELVGLVAQANCIDRFADGLSIARPPLGVPGEGQPSGTMPADTQQRDHWVPTADTEGPEVLRALSGVPKELEALFILSDIGVNDLASRRQTSST